MIAGYHEFVDDGALGGVECRSFRVFKIRTGLGPDRVGPGQGRGPGGGPGGGRGRGFRDLDLDDPEQVERVKGFMRQRGLSEKEIEERLKRMRERRGGGP